MKSTFIEFHYRTIDGHSVRCAIFEISVNDGDVVSIKVSVPVDKFDTPVEHPICVAHRYVYVP